MSIVFAAPWLRQNVWRSLWPSQELARRGFDAYMVGYEGEHKTTGWAKHDTVVLHLSNQDVGAAKTVAYLRSICRGVYVQMDDDYQALRDVQDVRDGQPGWYGDLMADIAGAIRASNGLIVSTPPILERWGRYASRTWVIRNYLPRWVTQIEPAPRHEGSVLWMGHLAGHRRDVEWIAPYLRRINEAAPGGFGTIGDAAGVAKVAGIRRFRAPCRGVLGINPKGGHGSTIRELYLAMARYSVGIVPLVADGFNESKSWIKPVEYNALGIPAVAVRLPSYDEARDRGATIRYVEGPEQMASLAVAIAANPPPDARREEMRATVSEHFTIDGPGGDAWQAWAYEAGAVPLTV